ncbi:MAG: hypothetical protein Athens071426_529 [Parcubacteria group bacterium Athens0714_26]|nr:MAG: hypothetical protein Athens101426_598 [Parcubacteria group bacterium Athens1014_26]TSD02286.1 MAG: hypothetical protein Athens071426_529 [Parcubacteria group bacterium Athens0714_26]
MKKFIIVTAIIAAGIAGAYFIILNFSYQQTTAPKISFNTEEQPQNNAPAKDFSLSPIAGEQQPDTTTNASQQPAEKQSNNLTELALKQITDSLAQNNPGGLQTIDDQQWIGVNDPDQLAQDIAANASGKFNINDLKPVIKDSDLNISSDNSKENLTNYFLSLNQIIRDSSKSIPPDIFTDTSKISLTTFNQLANAYQASFNRIIKLETPSSLLSIHKKELELLGTEANIYKKIANQTTDPMTAILASQNLTDVNSEFTNLQKDVISFMEKSKITI